MKAQTFGKTFFQMKITFFLAWTEGKWYRENKTHICIKKFTTNKEAFQFGSVIQIPFTALLIINFILLFKKIFVIWYDKHEFEL